MYKNLNHGHMNGQDGSYLAEHCLERGDKVFGTLKRNSIAETQDLRIAQLEHKITTLYADMTDMSSLLKCLEISKPDLIINTAAQSHVRISSDMPIYTAQVNAIGVLNLLEATKTLVPKARIYQCSSSEMYGNSIDPDNFQRLTTPMIPTSPYGIAKLFSFHMLRHYRTAYKMFCSNGVLFNHGSYRRSSNFVEAKIVKSALEIKFGLRDKLALGNLDTARDWGHSKDYTKAILMIMAHYKPDDFIIATGKSHTIRYICEYVFSKLNMDYMNYVIQDPKYMRPEELHVLRGDSSKAKKLLGWEPHYTFEMLLDELIEHWRIKIKEVSKK